MGRVLGIVCAIVCTAFFMQQSAADTLYITSAHALDVDSGKTISPAALLVEGGRIVEFGTSVSKPDDAAHIDLGSMTLLPGLIDLHVHLAADHKTHGYANLGVSIPRATLFGARNARNTLLAGFTTVRDVGAPGYVNVALREAIAAGDIPGPRVFAAGGIGITGGHCGDNNLLAPDFEVTSPAVADGPWASRALVRQRLKYGADLIKTCATGGVMSKGTEPGAPQASVEELTAIAEEAHSRGYKVAAHAHGATGIKNALRAGIDTIEHASFIDDEGLRMAKRQDATLVMDVYVTDYILSQGESVGMLPESLDKERRVGKRQRESFKRALDAGVRVAFGTDAGIFPHGTNARQFAIMKDHGMSPLDAIRAATTVAAEVLEAQHELGSLASGKYADVIAVDGDPLSDVSLLESVTFVMKNGVVVKDPR